PVPGGERRGEPARRHPRSRGRRGARRRAPLAALRARRRHPLAPRLAAGRGPGLAPAPLPRGGLRRPARAGGGAGRRPRPAARAPRAREPRHHRRADRGGVRGDRLRGGLPRPVPGHAQGGQRAQADRAGARLGAQALLHPARLRAHRPPHGGERAARAGGGAGGRAGRRGAPDDHPPGEGARVPRRGRPRPGPSAEARQPHTRARRGARRGGRANRLERARGDRAPRPGGASPEGARPRARRAGPPLLRRRPAGAAGPGQGSRVPGSRPPRPGEVVTSPTALADFRRCPRQHWYRHVLGLPERGTGGRRATRLGTAAHGVLEAIDLAAAPEDEIARLVAARPEALALRRSELEALAADLRAAAAALRGEIAAGLAIVGREVPFVLALPAGAPRVFLRGRLDLLARRGPAHVVRDYKYARPTAASVERYAPQLGAYELAVGAAGAAAVETELVFLRGAPVVRRLPPVDARDEEAALVEAGAALRH